MFLTKHKVSKRGSLYDSIAVPIYLLLIACTIFIAYYVWVTFAGNFQSISDTVILPDGGNLTEVVDDITISIGYLDYMYPLLVLGLLIVSLIFAFKTGSSVIYSYVSIVMWVLALMISVILSNTFELFETNFTSIGGSFLVISFVMGNMKWICLIWAFLISLVMFTRDQKETQQLAAAERVFG